MRAARRSEEFKAVQRESMQVAAVLRKALFSRRLLESPSPVQGGLTKQPPWKGLREEPPSPSGGSSGWTIGTRHRTLAYAPLMLRIGAT
jgi:hypothetical protein